MLVLTRRIGEKVKIGGGITVVVVDIRLQQDGTRKVRLGIEAPADVSVDREEIAIAKASGQRGNGPRATPGSQGGNLVQTPPGCSLIRPKAASGDIRTAYRVCEFCNTIIAPGQPTVDGRHLDCAVTLADGDAIDHEHGAM